MKLALYGAAGMIGSRIAKEALQREYAVSAFVRPPAKLELTHPLLTLSDAGMKDPHEVAAKIAGHDAVIVAVGPRGEGGLEGYLPSAQAMLDGCKQAGVKRLLWVGGMGSLEIEPGLRLMDAPNFPAEYLPDAQAHAAVLTLLRAETELEWTYASPPMQIAPGERRGKFKLGADAVVKDAKGQSRISAEDFAYACVYQLEKHGKIRQRFTAAYVD